jgi:magnesium transporter
MFAPEQLDPQRVESASPLLATSAASPDSLAPTPSESTHTNGKHQPKPSGGGKKQVRKATVNVRNWLRLDQHGETSMIQADKWKLTHKLGVQGRDLRIMDPSLATSYPSAILCREKALVVSLEHIKVLCWHSQLAIGRWFCSLIPYSYSYKMCRISLITQGAVAEGKRVLALSRHCRSLFSQ